MKIKLFSSIGNNASEEHCFDSLLGKEVPTTARRTFARASQRRSLPVLMGWVRVTL